MQDKGTSWHILFEKDISTLQRKQLHPWLFASTVAILDDDHKIDTTRWLPLRLLHWSFSKSVNSLYLHVFATWSTVHTTSSQVEGDLGVSWIFNTWLLLKMEKTHEWKRSYLRTYSFWDAHTVRKHISVTLPCFIQAFHVCWHWLYIIAISLHFSFVKISLWSSILPQQHLACFRRLQSIASQRPSLHQRPPAKNADIIGNLSGN